MSNSKVNNANQAPHPNNKTSIPDPRSRVSQIYRRVFIHHNRAVFPHKCLFKNKINICGKTVYLVCPEVEDKIYH